MKTPEQLFPEVEPIMGRILCYHVKSRSTTEHHFVDWVEGYCTCPDYHKTHKAREAQSGKPYLCYHMERSRDYGWAVNRDLARQMLTAPHTHIID